MATPTVISVPNYHPPCGIFAGLTEGGCTTGKNNKRANYCGKIHATTLVVDGSFNPGTYSHVVWNQQAAAGAIIPSTGSFNDPLPPTSLRDIPTIVWSATASNPVTDQGNFTAGGVFTTTQDTWVTYIAKIVWDDDVADPNSDQNKGSRRLSLIYTPPGATHASPWTGASGETMIATVMDQPHSNSALPKISTLSTNVFVPAGAQLHLMASQNSGSDRQIQGDTHSVGSEGSSLTTL